MEDIRTKSENTTPRQRAAAQIPKEAMRQLWLRSKEKGRTEIESTADGQQGGQYSEANQTGEKVSDALQSVGKSSAKVAVHKGRELAKKRAGQRHMEQSVERQEQTGQQSFSELQAPDGGQVSSNLTEPRECSVPSGKENPSANHSRISDSAKQTSDRNIKSNRLSVKEKPHDIKTAPHEIRGVSRDRKQIRTAASTVQAEQVAQQKAQQMAQRTRQAAKNASKQTRKAVKAVRAAIRHFLAALHTLTVAIIAGMSAATAVVVIICLVAFIAGSAYGIFFAAEAPDESSITVQQAVEQLTGEYRDELEHISDTVPHDRQEIEANDDVYYIRWQDVLAVFSSRVSGAEDGAPVAALDETRLDELREILWDMNEVSYTTREETVEVPAQNANTEASRDTASESTANDSGAESQESNEADTTTITQTVLTIHLTHKTPEEMQTAYNFTARQAEYLPLLQDPEYETLWAELLGGFAAGSSEILMPDTTHTPTGTLQWPLPIPGSITSPFGYRTDPLTGETSYHDGTDIAVPESTPILADADGTVTVANALDSWGGSYGYYVQIDHSSGLQTLYAHCSQICVTQGQQVQAGQVIAYVGHTGRATGNHLHFEVRENGERVDAMSYTHNSTIDALLNQKAQVAKKNNIDIRFKVNDLSGTKVAPMDLVIIIGNLLDNAIEACLKLPAGEREIYAQLLLEGTLFLSFRNTSPPVEIVNGYIATTKKPPDLHGFGLQNVKTALKKYDSFYDMAYEDGYFAFTIEMENDLPSATKNSFFAT